MAKLPGIPEIPSVSVAALSNASGRTAPPSSSDGRVSTKYNRKRQANIVGSNWNKNLRYYFAIAESDASTGEVISTPVPAIGGAKTNSQPNVFELYLNPQSLSISIPFAMTVAATNRGVVEENNGVVFRMITVSGTTGIMPDREGQAAPPAPTLLDRFFPGTMNAIRAVGPIAKVGQSIFGSGTGRETTNFGEDNSDALRATGYYQFWALNNWLVEYAEGKKERENSKNRLLFCCPRDGISYVVTPVSFDLRRDASQPNLYRYSIVLKAWDIALNAPTKIPGFEDFQAEDPGLSVRDVLSRIRKARKTLLASQNIIRAAQSDVNEAFQVISQTILAGKDVVDLAADCMDFLPTLVSNAQLIANTTFDRFSAAIDNLGLAGGRLLTLAFDPRAGEHNFSASTGGAGGSTLRKARLDKEQGGTLAQSVGAAANSVTGSASTSPSGSSPTGEIKDPGESQNSERVAYILASLADPEIADNLPLESFLPLPLELQAEVDTQTQFALGTTRGVAQEASDKLQEISDNLAYQNGSMDPLYAQIYGLPAPTAANVELTEESVLLSAELQDGREALIEAQAYDALFNGAEPDPFVSANEVLSEGQKVPSPLSGYPVIVLEGQSLDDLARIFLGDPDRAKEIAIFNSLRAPYLDELGFSLPISQASVRTFLTSDASKLAVNQIVHLNGLGLIPARGRIVDIKILDSNLFRITLETTHDLRVFTAATAPFLTARLPGTIGSGDTVLIPSENEPDQVLSQKKSPLSERLSYAEKVFKVDLAIDENGDLAISHTGDIARSYGYQNAIQAIRFLLQTELGELERHPSYGLDAQLGDRTNNISIAAITERIKSTILADPRFTDVIVKAKLEGTALRIRVEVAGAGGTGYVPVEFQIGL